MMNDIDLSAWEAPEPPADLADAVVARMNGTAMSVAPPTVRRRALLMAGGALAVFVIALGVWALVPGPASRPVEHRPLVAGGRPPVEDTIAALRPQIDACGETYRATGTVEAHVTVRADGTVKSVIVASTPDVHLGECVAQVIDGARFPPSNETTVFTYPFVFQAAQCDAGALKAKGLEYVRDGQHAAALAQFEASLRCKADDAVVRLAAEAACNAGNEAKQKLYVSKLPADTKLACGSCDADALKAKGLEDVGYGQHAAALAQFEASLRCRADDKVLLLAAEAACNAGNITRKKLYLSKLPPGTKLACGATCDAAALKNEGMEAINMGQHEVALAQFEQSLACKPDPYVTQLAFMSACNSRDATKAREYYGQLSTAQRDKLKVMCERNGIDIAITNGYLEIASKPKARILVDGVDTRLETPISGRKLPLSPGRHKVTFVIGQDRYTYVVRITAGQTESMTKDLQ